MKTEKIMGRNAFLNLARLFLPSWKFFNRVGESYVLEYRRADHIQSSTEWMCLDDRASRTWIHLFYNPHENHFFYINALVERCVREWMAIQPQTFVRAEREKMDVRPEVAVESPSHQLLRIAVAQLLAAKHAQTPAAQNWQIRICRQRSGQKQHHEMIATFFITNQARGRDAELV